MQKGLYWVVGVVTGVLLAPIQGVAVGVDTVIKYSTPPEILMDQGLSRLEEYSVKNHEELTVFVGLSPEKNSVHVVFSESSEDSTRNREKAREMCSDTIVQIKENLGMRMYKKAKRIALQRHSSPLKNKTTENRSIPEIIDESTLIGGKIFFEKGTVKCKSSLLNKNVVFVETPNPSVPIFASM